MSDDYFWNQYNSSYNTIQPISPINPAQKPDLNRSKDTKTIQTLDQRVQNLEHTVRKLSIENNNLSRELTDFKKRFSEMEKTIRETISYFRNY